MGQGAMLRIKNLSGNALKRVYEYHHQVTGWKPADAIPAGTGYQFYFEFDIGFFKEVGDDCGRANYQLEGTDLQVEFKADTAISSGGGMVFRLGMKNNWNDGVFKLDKLPVYLQYHTNKEHYGLPDKSMAYLADSVTDENGKFRVYEYNLVAIRDFCHDDKEAILIASKIMNQNYSDQMVMDFMQRVNSRVAACPIR